MSYRSNYPDVDIPDLNVCEVVMQRFAEFGQRAAIVDGPSGRTLSYADLLRDVDRLAAGLAARGFGRGSIFAICSPNVPEYATVLLGLYRLGGIATTMNPLYTAEEIARQLRETRAQLLLTIPPLAERCVEAIDSRKAIASSRRFRSSASARPPGSATLIISLKSRSV